jgi:hypothetical protein
LKSTCASIALPAFMLPAASCCFKHPSVQGPAGKGPRDPNWGPHE